VTAVEIDLLGGFAARVLFCLSQIAAWALFVTVAVPGFSGTPEGVEPIAIVSKVVEGIAVGLAVQ